MFFWEKKSLWCLSNLSWTLSIHITNQNFYQKEVFPIQASIKMHPVVSDANDNFKQIGKINENPEIHQLLPWKYSTKPQATWNGRWIYFFSPQRRSWETVRFYIFQEIHRILAQISLSKSKFCLFSRLQFYFCLFCYFVRHGPQTYISKQNPTLLKYNLNFCLGGNEKGGFEKIYLMSNIPAINHLQSVVAKINIFAVVVQEKEKGFDFIDLRRVHCCLQVLQTSTSSLIYIQVLLLYLFASFYSF